VPKPATRVGTDVSLSTLDAVPESEGPSPSGPLHSTAAGTNRHGSSTPSDDLLQIVLGGLGDYADAIGGGAVGVGFGAYGQLRGPADLGRHAGPPRSSLVVGLRAVDGDNWGPKAGATSRFVAAQRVAKVSGRVSVGLSGILGAYSQWESDANRPDLSNQERVFRATTTGGLTTAGALGGAWAGAQGGAAIGAGIGSFFGPGPGTAVGGAIGGGVGASSVGS
jgi:hypothetical protein